MGIQDNTVKVLIEIGLKRSKRYGVGYPHADGTYHYFEVEAKEEEANLSPAEKVNLSMAEIEHIMEKMDWTYAMSDDLRAFKAGKNMFNALVQKCKDAGMSEMAAQELQEKFLLNKGYKKPFTCMAIIHY
jgi:hypothetical protein